MFLWRYFLHKDNNPISLIWISLYRWSSSIIWRPKWKKNLTSSEEKGILPADWLSIPSCSSNSSWGLQSYIILHIWICHLHGHVHQFPKISLCTHILLVLFFWRTLTNIGLIYKINTQLEIIIYEGPITIKE